MATAITANRGRERRAREGSPVPGAPRHRNARGEGSRLRDEIIAAAGALLSETGDPTQISLRGVARRVGIAPTSVYLHFPDVEQLALAVANQYFAELAAVQDAAEHGLTDPPARLVERCRAYCRFGIEHPGHYRLMFRAELAPTMALKFQEVPGRTSFQALVDAVQRCAGSDAGRSAEDAQRVATLIWSMEHGLVSLAISRPRFPWPPIDELIADAVRRLLDSHTERHSD